MAKVNMKKSVVIGGLLVLILLVGIFLVNASVSKSKEWHSEDRVWVSVDNTKMTLKSAIDNNKFDDPTSSASVSPGNPGHSADKIWVSVDGDEMTLKQAISSAKGLCGSSSKSYSGNIGPGHRASEIEVSIDGKMSLQEAIDSGEFCGPVCVSQHYSSCYRGDVYWYDSCGGREGRKETCASDEECSLGNCVAACVSYEGDSCGGSSCVNPGTYSCDGSCTGKSNKPANTPCGGDKVCDGSGSCLYSHTDGYGNSWFSAAAIKSKEAAIEACRQYYNDNPYCDDPSGQCGTFCGTYSGSQICHASYAVNCHITPEAPGWSDYTCCSKAYHYEKANLNDDRMWIYYSAVSPGWCRWDAGWTGNGYDGCASFTDRWY